MQLLLDASLQGDWSGVTGNPVKFGLGYISIFFDIIFITQHYVLYPRARTTSGGGKTLEEAEDEDHVDTPLLETA